MDYRDFELRLGARSQDEYPIQVLRSPAGEARAVMTSQVLSAGGLLLGHSVARSVSVAGSGTGASARPKVGTVLFDSLFPTPIRTCYRVSRASLPKGCGLRIRLRIEPPELAALPWELLYDYEEGDYIGLSVETPIVRYLETEAPPKTLGVELPLRVLGMIASPSDLPRLDHEQERRRIEEALSALVASGLVSLDWLGGQTWRDLLHAMREGPWHVFHFVGHGWFDGIGHLVLANESGSSAMLPATQLGRLLADHEPLRMVVLNSCSGAKSGEEDAMSSSAATLVRRKIPAVVAMQSPLTDLAAVEFAREFYKAIAAGLPIDGAVTEGRKAISLAVEGTLEWSIPVLHMRAIDGRLFEVAKPTERRASDQDSRDSSSPQDWSELPVVSRKGWFWLVGILLVALAVYALLLLR